MFLMHLFVSSFADPLFTPDLLKWASLSEPVNWNHRGPKPKVKMEPQGRKGMNLTRSRQNQRPCCRLVAIVTCRKLQHMVTVLRKCVVLQEEHESAKSTDACGPSDVRTIIMALSHGSFLASEASELCLPEHNLEKALIGKFEKNFAKSLNACELSRSRSRSRTIYFSNISPRKMNKPSRLL
jgi:hypothetical protein